MFKILTACLFRQKVENETKFSLFLAIKRKQEWHSITSCQFDSSIALERFYMRAFNHSEISALWHVLMRYRREFVTSAPLSCHAGSRGPMRMRTNVVYFRVGEDCTVAMKLTMKLTMREPASMTTDTWSRRVTSDFYSALKTFIFKHLSHCWSL